MWRMIQRRATHKGPALLGQTGVRSALLEPRAYHWYEVPPQDPGEAVENLLHDVVVQSLSLEILLPGSFPVRLRI